MKDYLELLNQYEVKDGAQWANLLTGLSSNQADAILLKLIPEHFCSQGAKELHALLQKSYPQLLKIIRDTSAFFSSFPKSGIPAQS
ncbi:hypothetical protein MJH12_09800, partial [bacterium]|nr:hypothetical protein [bacterium]